MILVLHCALPGLFGIFARQPELLEVVLQQNLRGVGQIRLMTTGRYSPGWAFLDPAEDEMLHCIVADGPDPVTA